MQALKIRPPQQKYRQTAPLKAMQAIAKMFGEADVRIALADVAFTPDHPETVYVWEITNETLTGNKTFYVWSDANGDAGLCDEEGN
jgi:hypothetical protein